MFVVEKVADVKMGISRICGELGAHFQPVERVRNDGVDKKMREIVGSCGGTFEVGVGCKLETHFVRCKCSKPGDFEFHKIILANRQGFRKLHTDVFPVIFQFRDRVHIGVERANAGITFSVKRNLISSESDIGWIQSVYARARVVPVRVWPILPVQGGILYARVPVRALQIKEPDVIRALVALRPLFKTAVWNEVLTDRRTGSRPYRKSDYE